MSNKMNNSAKGKTKKSSKNQNRKMTRNQNASMIQKSVNLPVRSNRKVRVGQAQTFIRNGKTVVRHRELLFQVTSNASVTGYQQVGPLDPVNGVQIVPFRANPASALTFPWASKMAGLYERFRFSSIRFRYLPRVGSTQAGIIQIMPEYDSADSGRLFTETQVSCNQDTVEGPVALELVCVLDPARLNASFKTHYCMSDARFFQTAQDKKTVDPAFINVYLDSASTSFNFGRLWVEYEVEFDTPQFPTEALTQGGQELTSVVNGSGTPNVISTSVIDERESSPLTSTVDPTIASVTGGIGRFTRDWSGLANTIWSATAGSTITQQPILQRVSVKGPTTTRFDLASTGSTIGLNGAGTPACSNIQECFAAAGDYLALKPGTGSLSGSGAAWVQQLINLAGAGTF